MPGRKRMVPAAAPVAPPAKKQKEEPMLKAVKEAIGLCSKVPPSAQCMLIAGVGSCLGIPVEQRQAPQTSFIAMVEEALEEHLQSLQQDVPAEGAGPGRLEQANKALDDAKAAEEEKKAALVEASEKAAAAKVFVAEKEAAENANKLEMQDAESRKELLLNCLDKSYPVILEGGSEVNTAIKELQPILKGLGLEASLLGALPSSSLKTAEERGSFDKTVIDTLGKSLRDKVKELEEKALHTGEDAVAAAKEALQEVLSAQEKAASDHLAAMEGVGAAQAEVAKAKEVENQLENFRDYYMECFKLLRDATEKPAKAAEADAAAPAAEATKEDAEPAAEAAEAPEGGAAAEEPEPMLIGSA